eukprot:573263_1
MDGLLSVNMALVDSMNENSALVDQVMTAYDALERMKERITRQLNYKKAEVDKLLNKLDDVMDCSNDDEVYVPVPTDDDDDTDDDHALFGIQGSAIGCKKYKRYNIKIIMLAIDLAKKDATATHPIHHSICAEHVH